MVYSNISTEPEENGWDYTMETAIAFGKGNNHG
jgi:hypothetical protein